MTTRNRGSAIRVEELILISHKRSLTESEWQELDGLLQELGFQNDGPGLGYRMTGFCNFLSLGLFELTTDTDPQYVLLRSKNLDTDRGTGTATAIVRITKSGCLEINLWGEITPVMFQFKNEPTLEFRTLRDLIVKLGPLKFAIWLPSGSGALTKLLNQFEENRLPRIALALEDKRKIQEETIRMLLKRQDSIKFLAFQLCRQILKWLKLAKVRSTKE